MFVTATMKKDVYTGSLLQTDMKLYFSNFEDNCYPISFWENYKKENQLDKLELTEAAIVFGTGFFFCKIFKEVGEVGNCGKQCHKYKPNNGKNGRCKSYGYCYEATEKIITI